MEADVFMSPLIHNDLLCHQTSQLWSDIWILTYAACWTPLQMGTRKKTSLKKRESGRPDATTSATGLGLFYTNIGVDNIGQKHLMT